MAKNKIKNKFNLIKNTQTKSHILFSAKLSYVLLNNKYYNYRMEGRKKNEGEGGRRRAREKEGWGGKRRARKEGRVTMK